MKSLSSRRPADYVTPELPPGRVDRMWSAIDAPPRRAVAPRIAFALAALSLVAGGTWLVRGHAARPAEAPRASSGDVIVTQTGSSLTLPDGSALVLGATTKLLVAEASASRLRLELTQGSVTCDVVHVDGRVFEVAVADKLVRVRGTRFTVSVSPSGTAPSPVAVRVQRGRVEVLQAGATGATLIAALGPGQSWSQDDVERPAPAAEPAPLAAIEAPRAAPAPASTLETAAALLRQANAARVAARPADAARDYDRLRHRFPNDPRAGLASFELARIRLDTLHDARGALEALQFAEGHPHGAFVVEDAQALEIDALALLGRHDACVRARARFLAAHPSSPHAARVARGCAE